MFIYASTSIFRGQAVASHPSVRPTFPLACLRSDSSNGYANHVDRQGVHFYTSSPARPEEDLESKPSLSLLLVNRSPLSLSLSLSRYVGHERKVTRPIPSSARETVAEGERRKRREKERERERDRALRRERDRR